MALEQWFLKNAAFPQECGSFSEQLPSRCVGPDVLQACGVQQNGADPAVCGAHWTLLLLLATHGSTWATEQEAGEGFRQVIPDPPGPSRAGAGLTSV